MTILVVNTVVHFYTVSHLTGVTALKQMDKEFGGGFSFTEGSIHKMFWRVTLPVCLPTIFDYLDLSFCQCNDHSIRSCLFILVPTQTLASVAILNMDDAGDIAPAAAMGMMIFTLMHSLELSILF